MFNLGLKYEPVAIIGCPGGGTSFVARVLRNSGLYLGKDAGALNQRKYHESLSFKAINSAIYMLFGFNRDDNSHYLRNNPEENIKKINSLLNKEAIADILMFFKTRQYDYGIDDALNIFWGTKKRDVLWGFKDPKTALVLPVWHGLFPNMKVIAITKKALPELISRSSEGEHFRRMSQVIRDAHQNPPYLEEMNHFKLDFDEFCTNSNVLYNLLEWIGLNPLFDFEEVLIKNEFEPDRILLNA